MNEVWGIEHLKQQLLVNFASGVFMSSHYSGMMSPEQCMQSLMRVVKRKAACEGIVNIGPGFRSLFSCDIAEAPTQVAFAWRHEDNSTQLSGFTHTNVCHSKSDLYH